MAAAVRNITIEQGTTVTEVYSYAGNLAGYVGRSQVRDKAGAGVIVAEFTVTIVPGASTSTITRSLTATQTSEIPSTSKNLAHDMEIESSGGVVIRLVKGTVTLDPEVTR